MDYVPSRQGRAAIHRPECSLRSVECVLMHNITIFPFLHFVLIYLFKWHKVFFCVRVTLYHSVVEKNEVDAFFQKNQKQPINTHNDRLCIPEVLFTSLEKYLTCHTKKS